MKTATHLSRSTRYSLATFSITNAPRVLVDSHPFVTAIRGRRYAVPFEVDLEWRDGILSGTYVVRAWRMKRNGKPGKVASMLANPGSALTPDWLIGLVRDPKEPGTAGS